MKNLSQDRIREMMMEILDIVDSFCRKEGFTYFLTAGSLIGAVRHSGFIPWDDDMDIMMYRDEYEKFIDAFNKSNKKYYAYSLKDEGYNYPFCKICNVETSLTETNITVNDIELGVNIDLFPLDKLPEETYEKPILNKLHSLDKKMYGKSFVMNNLKNRSFKQKLLILNYRLWSTFTTRRKLGLEQQKTALMFSDKNTDQYSLIICQIRRKFPTIIRSQTVAIEHKFENHTYMIPSTYDQFLTEMYGDYMIPPPENNRRSGHNYSAKGSDGEAKKHKFHSILKKRTKAQDSSKNLTVGYNEENSLTLRQHQEIMLKMMREFDQYCNENHLSYFLTRGTLIGAIRHHGFIPWDDDVDVVMPRPDYEKLINANYISEDTQVLSIENAQGHYHPFPYCNLVDIHTIMDEKGIRKATNKGVFIDVFPLDGLPDNMHKRKWHLKRLVLLQIILANAINVPMGSNGGFKNRLKKLLGVILSPLDETKCAKKISNIAKMYSFDGSNDVVHAVQLKNHPDYFISPKTDYDNFVMMDFEGYRFRCPVGYDDILKKCYGDYMKLPPEGDQQGHHGITVYKIEG